MVFDSADETAMNSILDRPIDPGRSMFENSPEDRKSPSFSTKAVATIFFQRTDHWLRWLEQNGRTIDPKTKARFDVERDANNNRRYRLADIESLVKILYANRAISYTRMMVTLRILWLVGIGYEVVSVD